MGRPRLGARVWARVPDGLLTRIDAAAEADGRTRSRWIVRACERALGATMQYAWISGNRQDGYISARISGADVPWDQAWHDGLRDDLGIAVGDPIPDGWEPIEAPIDGAAVYRRSR